MNKTLSLTFCRRPKTNANIEKTLEIFIESGRGCAEVAWLGHYASPQSCYNALHVCATRLRLLSTIAFSVNGGKVFIIKL